MATAARSKYSFAQAPFFPVLIVGSGLHGAALLYTTAQIAVNQSSATAKEILLHSHRLLRARHRPMAVVAMLTVRREAFIAIGRGGEIAVLSKSRPWRRKCKSLHSPRYGYCGSDSAYCGAKCQNEFGKCN